MTLEATACLPLQAEASDVAIWGCAFGGKKLVQFAKHREITGREQGFIPAPFLAANLSEEKGEERG